MSLNLRHNFRIGEWEIRPIDGQIHGPDGNQHLQPKVMEVLVRLARQPGQLVERDHLLKDVWGPRAVSDEPLTRCIGELRRLLKDSVLNPTYIKTVPKRGYCLIAAIEPLPTKAVPADSLPGLVAEIVEDTRPNNLPVSPSPFINRQRELDVLAGAFAKSPLVTLTGAGGAGKTRLAIEVARNCLPKFRHGVWLVELAHLNSDRLIVQQIASCLGVTDSVGRSLEESLLRHLSKSELLLVLDNCEHVISGVADWATEALSNAKGFRLLATSRERLSLLGESVFELQPFSVPSDDLAEANDNESIRLFCQHAQLSHADFELGSKNVKPITDICRMLGGIPLALILAASHVNAMSVHEIRDRIGKGLYVPPSQVRDIPARHKTMEDAVQWTCDLLDSAQQSLFFRVSVFRGGFDLSAAQAICSDELESNDVLGLLEQLVLKSLIMADTDRRQTRYTVLEPIRQFAESVLRVRDEFEEARSGHRDYFLKLAAEGGVAVHTQADDWVPRLEQDHQNFRAALEWSLENNDGNSALDIVGSLAYYWVLSGNATEKRSWFDDALKLAENASGDSVARALLGAGMASGLDADYLRADEMLREAARLFDRNNNLTQVAWCNFWLGRNCTARVFMGGDPASLIEAIAFYRSALAWFSESENSYGCALVLTFKAWATILGGDKEQAFALSEEAISIADSSGVPRAALVARVHHAYHLTLTGQAREALALLSNSIGELHKLGDHHNARISAVLAGLVALSDGQEDLADSYAQLALKVEGLRSREWEPLTLGLAALVMLARGDKDSASRLVVALDLMNPNWTRSLCHCGLSDAAERREAALEQSPDQPTAPHPQWFSPVDTLKLAKNLVLDV